MEFDTSERKIGILGGGQLGKMLLTETRKLDVPTKVLDASETAPSRLGCNEFVQGSLLDYDTVVDFGKDVDILTIEIENVNLDALEHLESQGILVYPRTKGLRIIQNKAQQKLFYTDHDIPTVPFSRFAYTSEIRESLANGGLQLPLVWKSTQMGYDGRGVKIVRTVADLEGLPNVECIAEELVEDKIELAIIVARNPSGEVVTYPVVEMEFHPEANQVEYVICPARIPEDVAEKARKIGEKIVHELDHIGLLAVEMFLKENGELLVNEVAPRPHNSGHFTIEASYTNQFEQHLRAILDLPLGATRSKLPAIMVNLVGEEGHNGHAVYSHLREVMEIEGVSTHIYGKQQTRPFRKMGHITVVGDHPEKVRSIAENVKDLVKVVSK